MDTNKKNKEHKKNLQGGYRDFTSPLLKNGWVRCLSCNLDPGKKTLNHVDTTTFLKIKRETRTMYAYCNRVIQAVLHYARNPLAFVLVDKNATVFKVYCPDVLKDWLLSKDITEGTILSEKSSGVTAFSIGIDILDAYMTSGDEHYLDKFVDTTMYFSPCVLEDNSDEDFGQLNLLGGVGVIVPFQEPIGDYLPMLLSICKEVCLHMDMVDTFYRFYMTDTTGYICIDIDRNSGKPYTLYHNANIFNVLSIPYRDIVFQSAYAIFDPLPSNQLLWDIIDNRKHVRNTSIPITVNGVTGQYTVSTEVYRQSKVGYEGIRLFISNEEKISTFVSRKIGNNALLNFNNIIGQSDIIKETINIAKRYSEFDNNMLILGESGSGKDIFAQSIHNASSRKDGPFIAINCATFPKDLMVSELFGYESGAFTGSKKGGNTGKLELANKGTLFLDEIGTLPLDLQAILLRVIENKRFTRLGGNKEVSVDVRVIAATNEDILDLVEKNGFREDLYFRLSSFVLALPPLRERKGDIALLVHHFIEGVANRIHLSPPKVSKEALEYLESLPWRGNVRELQNFVEGIVQIFSPSVITQEHIDRYQSLTGNKKNLPQKVVQEKSKKVFFESNDEKVFTDISWKEKIIQALCKSGGNKTKAAAMLGISRKTLYKWIHRYDL